MWGPDRCPLDEEAIPGELDVGDAMVFVGNVYHAGGSNTTRFVLVLRLDWGIVSNIAES